MDSTRFDRIASVLSSETGRRDTLRLLGASLLGVGGLAVLGASESDARKKHKNKKERKPTPSLSPQPQPTPQPGLTPTPTPGVPAGPGSDPVAPPSGARTLWVHPTSGNDDATGADVIVGSGADQAVGAVEFASDTGDTVAPGHHSYFGI